MRDFIANYENENEKRINYGLITREYDEDLIKLIVNACKSLEVLEYIKFLGYTFIEDEKEIDLNEYMTTRKKSRKKSDTRYMYMQDSRYMELRLKFKLECKGEEAIVTKKLLIPVADENGYYTIKGKKYLLLYQLVDSSTYTTRQNLTLKSLVPVVLKRVKGEFEDTDGNFYTAPTYLLIFRKEIDLLLIYFAKMGVTKTLKFFSVDKVVRFVEEEGDKENNIYFKIKNKLFLEVNRYFFLKYQYVQSIVSMILRFVTNRLNYEDLDNRNYWIEWIGSMHATNSYNYMEKGLNTLKFIERMLDETTKDILKINDSNKKSIYSILRWMVQNYNELRKKDNMDLTNKRLRCNEYIVSLLTKAFNERMNRVIAAGSRVTLDKVKEILKFSGNILMDQLHISGLLRYDDRINDMDFFAKLRFTLKGPNSLGNKNENNIPMKYRGIHPSYLGRLDINVCGTSDPGSSGIITPFCKTEGLYFDGAHEPEDGIFDFQKEMSKKHKEQNKDILYVDPFEKCETIQELFDQERNLREVVRMSSIKRTEYDNGYLRVWININDNDDDL
jgi:hypothetical protein